MTPDFLKIAITRSYISDPRAEAMHIARLLDGDADLVHLRYPGEKDELILQMISLIPENLRGRLSIHDHHEWAVREMVHSAPGGPRLGIGGVHFNARNPFLPETYYGGLRLTASCHSIREIREITGYSPDYVTLSPIFDSISKPGYASAFNLKELAEQLENVPTRVIALGGVTPDKIPALKDAGFGGCAMLGYYESFRPSH